MVSLTKKYLTWQRPLYLNNIGDKKHFEIPVKSIVDAIDFSELNERQQVEYKGIRGWVETPYLEEYIEQFEGEAVDLSGMQTPNQDDAQQYINFNGRTIFNACGPISCAYLLQKSLKDLLEGWQAENPNHYNRVTGSNWLTGVDDLLIILAKEQPEKIRLTRYTPEALERLMPCIVAVSINKYTGRLGSTTRHWVVPVSVWKDRQGYGTIDIYNPFPNRIERYGWGEFIAAAGMVNGVTLV